MCNNDISMIIEEPLNQSLLWLMASSKFDDNAVAVDNMIFPNLTLPPGLVTNLEISLISFNYNNINNSIKFIDQ